MFKLLFKALFLLLAADPVNKCIKQAFQIGKNCFELKFKEKDKNISFLVNCLLTLFMIGVYCYCVSLVI